MSVVRDNWSRRMEVRLAALRINVMENFTICEDGHMDWRGDCRDPGFIPYDNDGIRWTGVLVVAVPPR